MLKKILLALIPVALLAMNATASDDVLADIDGLKVASISDAKIEIDTGDLNLDVDALAANTEGKSDQAIEACFHRFGYGYGGYGCGYGSYWGCYSPYYYNYCYSPVYCYRPVYYYTPCYTYYSYWGCW
jgi:hypothetical protein